MFPHPITCLTFDSLNRFFFAGTEEGVVYHVNLYRKAPEPKGASRGGWEGVPAVVHVDATEDSGQYRSINAE